MKSITKKIIKTILSLSSIMFISICTAIVPDQYYANYTIKDDREDISRIFIEIQANNDIGVQTPTTTFYELYKNFSNIFPQFPQEYSFQIIYQRCLQLTQSLSNNYDYNTFSSFTNLCYKPLSNILNQIDSAYSVKASVSANPTLGSAPLTVTFDARNSVDPSNETIPTDNYFWYYRDVNGVDQPIGIGSVLSHTFQEAGVYLIHLTVRSSNYDKGFFDGERTFSVNVTPKSAIISVYANSLKLNSLDKQKFGTQEGLNGIVFDGSATIPLGGRVIQKHSRTITSNDGFKFYQEGEGNPGIIKVVLPNNGEYLVTLKTNDNEGNSVSEKYSLLISDPVAIIKKSPEEGTTNTMFSFDSNTSYSVMSSLRLHTWEIFNEAGDKINTYQGKTIKNQFKKPGSYTVKLTVEDELGQTNTDTIKVNVESSSPVAQFNIKDYDNWKYPSKFLLDASLSSDIDVVNNYDVLYYNRSFSDPENTIIEQTDKENKQVVISFNSVGTHTITLTVTDKYGKTNSISKTIELKSVIRPEIITSTQTAIWGDQIDFVAQANKDIINYSRDFGDGKTITTQSNKISHIYTQAGAYEVKLSVIGADWTENEIYKNIFIGNKNEPIGAYVVYGNNNIVLRQNEECSYVDNGNTYTVPAYKVTRYNDVIINPSELSTNIKGTKTNLNYYFQEKFKSIINTSNNYKVKFNELGCSYVDFTVEDTSIGITNKQRIRFKVYNNLPTLSNVSLSFPQYGNESGIGFNEGYVKDIFNYNYDPLIVKVNADGAKDPDGFISYYKRYYYYKDDPGRILETKITPSNINYTYFSIPQTPGEFMFGVTMYDNDDGKQSSEEILGNGPIVFFPPDTERPDIPIVTLKVDKTTVEIGDEITFNVISKIISDRSDFIQERTIMYDFDGDGERDLTTKDDRVTYTYTKANDMGYTPRAAVLYRGYQGDTKGETIIVKEGLKPRIMYTNAGKFVLFRDVSLGNIESSTVYLNYLDYLKENNGNIQDTKENKNFYFEYPDFGEYYISTILVDKYANTAKKQTFLTLTGITNPDGTKTNYNGYYKFLSLPGYEETENGSLEISVGKNLDNSILFYVLFNDFGNENRQCFVDLDISDGNSKDFYCNEMYFAKFDPKYESIAGKLYYETENGLESKDLIISFLDYSIKLDENTKIIYDKLTSLIYGISNEDTLKALLINLQKGILNKSENQSNVVAIQEYIENNPTINISNTEKDELNRILAELTDSTIISAAGGTEYDYAKYEILAILPTNLKTEIEQLFYNFENAKGDKENSIDEKEVKKGILNQILSLVTSKINTDGEQKEDEISKSDMDDIIMPNMCTILNYYDIPSEKCSSENTKIIDNSEIKVKTKSGLKIVLIVIGSIIGILVLMILAFAIKAKLHKDND